MLKLGSFGVATQVDFYSMRIWESDMCRSFVPEVLNGEYGMKSDVWSFGIMLLKMLRIAPYNGYCLASIPQAIRDGELPFYNWNIESKELLDFLKKCFVKDVNERWSVNELMTVSDWDRE